MQKIGSDLVIITVDGYMPLSKVLDNSRSTNIEALSDKIRDEVLKATRSYQSNFGWEIILYPLGNMGIVNVPISTTSFVQHVINTQTGAWCRFRGMNARCWAMFNDRLYFGGAGGFVYKADTGSSDADGAIHAVGQTAWNYIGSRNSLKRFTAVRPLMKTRGSIAYRVGLGTDFGKISQATSVSTATLISTPWGSPWGSPWSDRDRISDDWQGADGIGNNVSAQIDILTSSKPVDWLATQFLHEPGKGAF
jgi:hypothetical protein